MTEPRARILCIDDEEMIRRTMGDYLTDSGFEMSEAENGREGLKRFEAEQPDLVLVDLRMPEVDGLDVLATITQNSPETPIIVVSGTGVMEDAIEALRLGAWDYITKPIEDMAILEIAVDNALKHARLLKENRQYQKNLEQEVKKRTAELNKAHEKLKEQHMFLEALLESIPNPIFYKDTNGRYLGCNKSFCHLFGLSKEEIIGKKTEEFTQNENLAIFKETDQQIFEKQTIRTYEYSMVLPDKTVHHLFTTKAPFKNVKGELAGIVGVTSDITELRKAQEEKTLLEEQLRHSQKMEAVGTLAGGIAHDFNNILQAMSGYMQLLLMKKEKDDPDYRYLAKIDQATERATNLVRRLLTFSRKSETHFYSVDINAIVINVIHLLKKAISPMVRIETRLSDELPRITADPNQIEQALVNLANNAFDAMPEGGILIFETTCFGLEREYQSKYLDLDSGTYVLITISDTGCGIDKDTQKHIFEPFFTTKAFGKGTGLGLATVYGIVKHHKGRIMCYSEPGTGAVFRIYLPAEGDDRQSFANATEQTEDKIPGGNETILIADDEETLLYMAEEILKKYGYTVKQARTGEEALSIYLREKEQIDLVILDLGMPGMGGEKCLEKILNTNAEAKVIVVSGYAAHKISAEPEKYGASAFISKPYQMYELLYKIRGVLDYLH